MAEAKSSNQSRFYQQYPRVPVVITARAGERSNAMVAARHTVVSSNPPNYGISISEDSLTYQLIMESREFGVNFLPFEEAALVDSLGSTRGKEIDKFQQFDIAVVPPEKTGVPVLKAAYAAYECRLVSDTAYNRTHWLVGEIVAMRSLRECLAEPGILDLARVNPTLYMGSQRYLTVAKDTMKYIPR